MKKRSILCPSIDQLLLSHGWVIPAFCVGIPSSSFLIYVGLCARARHGPWFGYRQAYSAASIWFEIWGVVDPGQKHFDFSWQISEKFRFFRQFHKKFNF